MGGNSGKNCVLWKQSATSFQTTKKEKIMRALLQRVSQSSVEVSGHTIGKIDQGLLILICAMESDSPKDADQLASKISKLRIFTDEAGKMNRSLIDIGGAALVVSQFTLAADTSRGNRPGFSTAMSPDKAGPLFELFMKKLQTTYPKVKQGVFGADMQVHLVNDGPITISLETKNP